MEHELKQNEMGRQ